MKIGPPRRRGRPAHSLADPKKAVADDIPKDVRDKRQAETQKEIFRLKVQDYLRRAEVGDRLLVTSYL